MDTACKADKDKFCKDVKHGGGATGKCLREHKDELSDPCKQLMEAREKKQQAELQEKQRQEKREAWIAACGADKDKLCKDVKSGVGATSKCLKEHKDELSASCKQYLEARDKKQQAELEEKQKQEKKDAWNTACGADMDKFCKDVKAGHGEKAKCLKAHEAELSQVCKDKLAEKKETKEEKKEEKKEESKPADKK